MHPENFIESTAVEQGFNCEKLCKLLNHIKSGSRKLQSLVILRNGRLVMNVQAFPFYDDVPRYINCCTESIISALVGIAIGEGLIKGVDDRVSDYFPEYAPVFDSETEGNEKPKRMITLEHLLTMTAGLEWNDTRVIYGENSYDSRMHASEDPVRFILEQPMGEEPGKRYNHCLGAMHLLSAILQKASGMSVADYAELRLFKPLGITPVEWAMDKNGIHCGNGISMPTWGLAKIGQLYLQKGRWGDTQIIPEAWVSISTKKHMDTPEGPWSFYGCGYQWNINRFGGYSSKGVNGQYLAVVPNLNLVVVMSSPLPLDQFYWYETLMETFIIPSARFPGPRQTGFKAQSLLEEAIDDFVRPPLPQSVPPLPGISKKISGKEFIFKPGSHLDKLSFHFNARGKCHMKVWSNNELNEVSIGLDDVYRISGKEAFKGTWENDCTLAVKVLNLQFNYELMYLFVFDGDKLCHEIHSPGWGLCERIEGFIS